MVAPKTIGDINFSDNVDAIAFFEERFSYEMNDFKNSFESDISSSISEDPNFLEFGEYTRIALCENFGYYSSNEDVSVRDFLRDNIEPDSIDLKSAIENIFYIMADDNIDVGPSLDKLNVGDCSISIEQILSDNALSMKFVADIVGILRGIQTFIVTNTTNEAYQKLVPTQTGVQGLYPWHN